MHLAYLQEPLFVCLVCALHVLTSRQIGILATDLRSSTERAPLVVVLCTTAMQSHTMTTAGTETRANATHVEESAFVTSIEKQEMKLFRLIITVTISRKRSIAVYNYKVIFLILCFIIFNFINWKIHY